MLVFIVIGKLWVRNGGYQGFTQENYIYYYCVIVLGCVNVETNYDELIESFKYERHNLARLYRKEKHLMSEEQRNRIRKIIPIQCKAIDEFEEEDKRLTRDMLKEIYE